MGHWRTDDIMTTTGDSNNWPALSRVSEMTEPDRRLLLRLHSESGFDAADDRRSIDLRRQLDAELGQIASLELRAEIATGEDQKSVEELSRIPGFKALTQTSPSFVQYLNSYLFFGVRFAAGRLANPCTVPPRQDEWNERAVGLPSPPPCEGV